MRETWACIMLPVTFLGTAATGSGLFFWLSIGVWALVGSQLAKIEEAKED